jgi:hypothetical protein
MRIDPVAKAAPVAKDSKVAYWCDELERAKKRFRTFWEAGDVVVDTYRLQKADGNEAASKDKFNILYSSTETIRPNLYGQTPKPRVVLRSKDTATPVTRAAVLLLEGCLEYVQDEEDFDSVMDNAVEDFLLPGLGQAWVRYEAKIEGEGDQQKLLDEMVKFDYLHWQDFLTGVARTWKDVPWVAKRIWLTKEDAAARFGKDKADKLVYAQREPTGRDMDNPSETAEAWEIWVKSSRMVYWYAEGLDTLLDEKPDPLKLKGFFPCPRPLRAISNTRTLVPRALYSQYKSQAETLNILTKRIRYLGEALRVVGLYDGSQTKLSDVLNPAAGNRMIPVDNWAMFAQNGGINGAVAWVPIDHIIKVLSELLKAREVCKAEIYEITGFSDIVRGVSKASETLGAQNIKADWAGARVKKMQKEVQRFAKDLLAIAGEVIAEHCSPETIAIFSGISIPTGEEVQANPQLQERIQLFTNATALMKSELKRVSAIDIETDSTLMANDEQERAERAQFLSAAGAFLQQAVPAMEATPELGPLLGSLLMFTVRSFPSARIVEEEFERVQQAMAGRAQSQDQDKDGKKAKAAADAQKAAADAEIKKAELEQQGLVEKGKHDREVQAENNRHAEKMEELRLREREVAIKERELAIREEELKIEQEDAKVRKFTAMHEAAMREGDQELRETEAERKDEREYDKMDRDDDHKDADRMAAAEAGEADREAESAKEGSETSDDA